MNLEKSLYHISKKKRLNLILAGGNSPLKFYKTMSRFDINWKNINIFLLDDRIVSHKSKFSNYNNIKKSFKTNRIAFKNIKSLLKINTKNIISSLKKFKTFSIIGLGSDGHFASIFSNSFTYRKAVNIKTKPAYFKTEEIGSPKRKRISMNLSMILLSDIIILFLKDKKKFTLFKKIVESEKKDFFPVFFLTKYARKIIYL